MTRGTVLRPPFARGAGAFILHYVKIRRWAFLALLVMICAAAVCGVGVQYSMKLIVDGMAAASHDAVWFALGILVGLIALESVLWRLSGWLGCRTTVDIGVHVRLDLFDYLSHQPMRYFAENLAGSLGQRLTATAGNFGALTNTTVWRILPPFVDFAGAVILLWTVDLGMMVALGAFVILVTAGLIWFGERGRSHHRTYAARAGEVGGQLIDIISNMWSVKGFSARERERDGLAHSFVIEADAQRKSWMYTEKARLLHDIALWFMTGGVLVWAVHLWSAERISPGDVVLVGTLTFRILHGSRDMALSLVDMVQQFGFIEDTLGVIGQPQTVVDASDAKPIAWQGKSIEFDRVTFAYGGRRAILRDLSLVIPAGQKVGIVGPSGAGKSTIVHLLQRLHDVEAGDIRIDGQSVAKVTQDSLRSVLAVAPQEITLFHRSIRDNIRFARPDATNREIEDAARAAAAHDFIVNLPQGYDTIVGERGTKLSGGQRQRVGIARAFLKDAPVVVLDEATSALDTESELEVQRALADLRRDRTVIAVAHRLSTLAAFDRILVIAGGRLVEDGPPDALRRAGGIFSKMWRLQAEGMSSDAAELAAAVLVGSVPAEDEASESDREMEGA
jgi:ATP-binding cassette subfamily B protein